MKWRICGLLVLFICVSSSVVGEPTSVQFASAPLGIDGLMTDAAGTLYKVTFSTTVFGPLRYTQFGPESVATSVTAAAGPPLSAGTVPLNWVVEGSLASGGTVSGTFQWPGGPAAGYANVAISVVSDVAGDSVFHQLEGVSSQGFTASNADGSAFLLLIFSDPLSDMGGSFGLSGGVTPHGGPQDLIIDGTVSSVPEPSTLFLLALGLASVGALSRRRP